MERKKAEMNKISQVEYDILNALYFVEPFENILDEVDASRPVIVDSLKTLIDKKYVSPLHFDEEKGDFVKTYIYDSDNMQNYSFLATKEGLMLHNNSIIDDES